MEVDDRTETGQRGDTSAPLLAVHDLSVEIQSEDGVVHAVDRVSWSVNRGQVLGIVGESGSGKSVGCLSLVAGGAGAGEAPHGGGRGRVRGRRPARLLGAPARLDPGPEDRDDLPGP